MNKIFAITFLGLSPMFFSQLKEEKLILDKKREPEVKKIEKIKTSIPNEKNYPPKEKKIEDSLNLKYEVVNVPMVSDFTTSKIQGSDLSPKIDNHHENNYLRIGYGNYGKLLADGNISTTLENKVEVGADLHYLSSNGLKRKYNWKSNHYTADLSVFGKHYGEQGKASIEAGFVRNGYNFYGIYNNLDVNTDLGQHTNQFNINGYYDFYSNEILNDIRVKSSFLNDKFKSREFQTEILANLSKHNLALPNDFTMNADLGVGLLTQNTKFSEIEANYSNFFSTNIEPKLTFFSGKSYLKIGSNFTFLNAKNQSNTLAEKIKSSKIYWFPNAEISINIQKEINFYAGINGRLSINSYTGLLQQNPYLAPSQPLAPTETKYNIYLGAKGDVNQNFKYDISAGFSKIKNIMFFQSNDLITIPATRAYQFANTFSATYDSGNLYFIKGNIQYYPIANLVIDGELNLQKYKLDHHKYIYNIPVVKAEIGAKYMLLEKKLHLVGKAFIVSDRTSNAFIFDNLSLASQEETNKKVGGYADINFSAEYRINKNFSIFALANNLLGTNYQIYNGYRVLGTQILGGLKISF